MSQKHIIVIRKKKGHGGGHHGGSWKIAYADFMTAMMAFFLVMWLLSTSTPLQREQIAEYFKTPLKVALSNGEKSSLSDSVIPGGGADPVKNDGEVNKANLKKIEGKKDKRKLADAREELDKLIRNDARLKNYQANLRLSLTEDGLLIQIIDSNDRPMFKVGSKTLEPYLNDILKALVPVLNTLPNRITLTGHTDSLRYANGDIGYSNWELSADRANALRRALIAGGMPGNKFLRVIGTADTMNVENSSADDPVNRRISILVLSRNKEESILNEDTLVQNMAASDEDEKLKAILNMRPVTAEELHQLPAAQPESGVEK
ncbi:MAG: flagellar motor protein MotB [Pantoea sp.]|uniref:OmpA-like domain-containing protein n=1 Tax=Pantoea septica TaxID=472695 RepID=A0ABX3UVU0_9GAMM|nr:MULTISPECIES: flagellar motor protein MotB [Pantoea]MDU5781150.1 flagellar motor protein MotB [Pantoea sp.]ORN02589.1 hypothetical protein HA46_03290 [Pantoea septica]